MRDGYQSSRPRPDYITPDAGLRQALGVSSSFPGYEVRITEREVTVLLADFAAVWSELFPAEQARIVQLLVERVDVQEERSRCGSGRRASQASLQNSGSTMKESGMRKGRRGAARR